MKIEDFKSRFNSIVSNPDTGIADASDFLTEVEADYTNATNLAEKVEELEARVKDLQETNIKLYLAQTGASEEENDEPDETDGEAYIDNFFENLMKEEED